MLSVKALIRVAKRELETSECFRIHEMSLIQAIERRIGPPKRLGGELARFVRKRELVAFN